LRLARLRFNLVVRSGQEHVGPDRPRASGPGLGGLVPFAFVQDRSPRLSSVRESICLATPVLPTAEPREPPSVMASPPMPWFLELPVRAVVITAPGGPEVLNLEEVPDPVPGEGEVVVEVAAAGVNPADVMQRQGFYPPPPGASAYPGLECSGRIAAVRPGASGWHERVRRGALLAGRGYAERVAVPAGQLLPIPGGVSLIDAAALPEVACTVNASVFGQARLAPGEVLLVHGG